MAYEDWCKTHFSHVLIHGLAAIQMSLGKSLNKSELDTLRFLAENDPVTKYSLWKGVRLPEIKRPGKRKVKEKAPPKRGKSLGYSHPLILRNIETLETHELIQVEQKNKGRLKREFLKLTFNGMVVYLEAWKELDTEAKKSIEKALINYRDFFPFSKYWDEMVRRVGLNQALGSLVQTAKEIEGQFVKINITGMKPFKAFVNLNILRYKKRKVGRNEEFSEFLSACPELKNAYISYLTLEDIILFVTGRLKNASWESRKELCFPKERNYSPKALPLVEQLKILLPKYADIPHVFTGMLMEKLLWRETILKKAPPILERNGFRISFGPGVFVV